jgi:hypothetical protein
VPAVHLIFAGVSGSPGSVHALGYAAGLTRHRDAILVPPAGAPPGGDLDERTHPSLHLRELWKDDAWQRLWAALDTVFGAFPPGARTWPLVLGGKPGQVLVSTARQAGDLLVIGTGQGAAPAADRLPGEPLLPESRPMPGPGHPAPGAGPADPAAGT